MKSGNYANIKPKYWLLSVLFVWLCIAVTAYPAWDVALWLAEVLQIDPDAPIKDQENGWLWVGLFLGEAIITFLAVYLLLSILFAILGRWSRETYIGVFWKNKHPDDWEK